MTKKSDDTEGQGKSFLSRFLLLFIFFIIFTSLALIIFFRFLSVYVGPGEFAVKQVQLGFLIFEKGIQNKIYGSGYTLQIPYIQKVYIFPRRLQVLEFTDRPSPEEKFRHFEKAAYIQTSDGYYVRVDLSIIYKITDPYKLITWLGPGNIYIKEGIVPKAEPILKQTLGELTTEGIYNSPLRVRNAEAAKNELNSLLNAKGLNVDAVLIRYFQYSEQIQKNIEEKKLKDQQVFKNQAEARAATEAANLKKVIEEGKASVKVKLEEGQGYVALKRAEKERFVREKKAEANLLIKLADAKKTKLKNQAMTGEGADRLVGMEMAEVLKGIQIIMIPSDGKNGYNPLDLQQTMEIFEINK